ncbi:hypothetical protein D3C71_962420 [compost metagenome]
MVGTYAGSQHEAFVELQGVEHIQRGRGGLAVGAGTGAAGAQAGGVPVRVVQVGWPPARADGAGLAPGLLLLLGELQAGAEVVLHAAGCEVDTQVQLVGKDGVFLILVGQVAAIHRVGGQVIDVRPLDVAGRAARRHEGGEQVVLLGLAPAGGVGELERVGEVMFKAERRLLRGHVVVVVAGAVEVFRVHRVAGKLLKARLRAPARQADGRHEAVGDVVLLQIEQVEEVAGAGAQAEAERRRDAPALVVDVVAAGDIAVLPHGIDAQRGGGAQSLVPVAGRTLLAVNAGRNGAGHRVTQVGLFADHVDRAGGGGAADVGAGRAFHHFNLLGVEHVARDRTQVADAVHQDAARAVETAHVHGVTGAGVAVFTGIEGADAGGVAQRFGQGGGALLVEQIAGDHLDGLRGVLQRLGVLGVGRLLALVAGGGMHFDLVQRLCVAVGRLRQGQGRERDQAGDQAGGRGQGADAAGRGSMLAAFDMRHEKRVCQGKGSDGHGQERMDAVVQCVERVGAVSSWLAMAGQGTAQDQWLAGAVMRKGLRQTAGAMPATNAIRPAEGRGRDSAADTVPADNGATVPRRAGAGCRRRRPQTCRPAQPRGRSAGRAYRQGAGARCGRTQHPIQQSR